jgi:hypothetical protein
MAQLCGAPDANAIDVPVQHIAQAVQPNNPDQQARLDALKDAEARAADVLKAACPAQTPATPIERLDLVELRLTAILQAIDILHPALGDFYASLTDEQKARFNQMDQLQQAGQARRQFAGGAGSAAPPPGCARQTGAPAFPIERIGQVVQPDAAQLAALEQLRDTVARAADLIRTACPSQTPLTPTGRLGAVHDRVQAMLDATKVVRPALEKFYASLNDEQKARFNTMSQQQARDNAG